MNKQIKILFFSSAFSLLFVLFGCAHFNVGSSCLSNESCDKGLFCDTGTKGGYCTAECSAALPCPGQSICSTIQTTTKKGEKVEFNRCLQTCLVRSDCRKGYICKMILKSQQKVCFSSD